MKSVLVSTLVALVTGTVTVPMSLFQRLILQVRQHFRSCQNALVFYKILIEMIFFFIIIYGKKTQ